MATPSSWCIGNAERSTSSSAACPSRVQAALFCLVLLYFFAKHVYRPPDQVEAGCDSEDALQPGRQVKEMAFYTETRISSYVIRLGTVPCKPKTARGEYKKCNAAKYPRRRTHVRIIRDIVTHTGIIRDIRTPRRGAVSPAAGASSLP